MKKSDQLAGGEIKTIRAFYPFKYPSSIDPRSIFGVGEQVVSEYAFAFHARTTQKRGFEGLFSKIAVNEQSNELTIYLVERPVAGDGGELTFADICNGIKSSMSGTRHAQYSSILKGISCDELKRAITISFSRVPLNLRYLFTLPDFSIFNPKNLPMSEVNGHSTSGPYNVESIEPGLVRLSINKNYPNKLRANSIGLAELVNYSPERTQEFIRSMSPESVHAAYFFGHALEAEDVGLLRERGYTVETFPTEWFVYLLLKKSVNQNLRAAIVGAIDSFRSHELERVSLGIPAYSIAPSDRGFSLNQAEYDLAKPKAEKLDMNASFHVATLENWAKVPFNAKVLEYLKTKFPNMKVTLVPQQEAMRLFSKDIDISLSLLGISPSDPLSHLSFLESTLDGFSEIVSKQQITDLAVMNDPQAFNSALKNIESKIVESALVTPIGHFPGVVAYRKDFKIDESISFGWGIQTWSFHVN